jgi:hypothetical protein
MRFTEDSGLLLCQHRKSVGKSLLPKAALDMTKRMKLLIGLLVLGIVLLGSGLVFLLLSPHQTEIKVTLTPAPGTYLFNSQNESSKVLLKSVQIEKSISDKDYFGVGLAETINAGEPLLIVSGTVQNNNPTNKEIMMYAVGYDKTGKQVSWTHDASSIVGQIGFHLETGETAEFTLHLNFAENIKAINIFANNYSQIPP